jgi:uncharacterized protein (TIGR00369 family)
MGTLHGGVLWDLADAAMGVAYLSTLAEGETFTTIELKINFLRPVWKARVRAQAKVVRAGKTVVLVECDILDEQQRLVARAARASSTCMTVVPRPGVEPGLEVPESYSVGCTEGPLMYTNRQFSRVYSFHTTSEVAHFTTTSTPVRAKSGQSMDGCHDPTWGTGTSVAQISFAEIGKFDSPCPRFARWKARLRQMKGASGNPSTPTSE